MADCCDAAPSTLAAVTCPVSGTVGKPVALETVKGVLREAALRRLSPGVPHRFCTAPRCQIVYFDDAGGLYRPHDLRVPVWEKEPFGARMICYCFDENEADMREECERSGDSQAAARVRAHIAAGRCACEIRNPRGVCCLGDVMAAVSRVRQAVGQETR